MSDEIPSNGPILTPEKEAKRATLRRVMTGLVVGAAAVGVVILLLALMPSGDNNSYDSGVVIRVDNPAQAAHFEMVTQPDGTAAKDGVLVGEPLGNTYLTTASTVRSYYNNLLAEKGLDGGLTGANNYVGEKGSLALFYTFYLKNTSETEAQFFRISATLNQKISTLQDGSGARAYEYVRLGLFMGNNGSADDDVRYFALANSTMPTELASDDYRECLSTYQVIYGDDGSRSRAAIYEDGDIGYAEVFTPGQDQTGLFDIDELAIPANATRRVTFLAYLEAEDPDTFKAPSQNQALSFSLHIGV